VDSLACKDGQLIASEEELLARYRVSRPTLRQAAAIVAQEQLLKVKRGVNGGYVAVRPAGEAVAHMAAIYLQARGAGLGEILRAVEPIRVELARLAASNADGKTREEIGQFLQKDLHPSDDSYRGFLRSEREFGEILGKASRNEVLSLFLKILYDLAATMKPQSDVYIGRPARVAEYRKVRTGIARAVVEGDAEIAMLAARRGAALVAGWMTADEQTQRSRPRNAGSRGVKKGSRSGGRKSAKVEKSERRIAS
jgi:DNA-binding FadR family transcriptional regulator